MCTEPFYQSESSDSVSRNQLETPTRFYYIWLWVCSYHFTKFIAIYSTNLMSLSIFKHFPFSSPSFFSNWELNQSSALHGNTFCMHSDILFTVSAPQTNFLDIHTQSYLVEIRTDLKIFGPVIIFCISTILHHSHHKYITYVFTKLYSIHFHWQVWSF